MTGAEARPHDETASLAVMRRLVMCLGLVLAAQAPAAPAGFADSKPLYDDPRIAQWAADYINGKQDVVLTQVEADLKSDSPALLSPGIWTAIHLNRGDLSDAAAAADPAIKHRLGSLPEMTVALRRNDYRKVMALWAARTPEDADDYELLSDVLTAAESVGDYDALYEITRHLLTKFPDCYLGIIYSENDQGDLALRDRYLALLASPELVANPDVKAAAQHLVQRRWYSIDKFAESAAFLAKHGADHNALWNNANALYELDRFAEAAKAYEREFRAYPFETILTLRIAWSKALARDEKYDEAKRVAKFAASADATKIRPAEAAAEIILIQGELDAGEKGEARREFERAIASFPQNPALQDLGARLELQSNQPKEAAEHAGIAVAADPSNIGYQEHLIAALAKTDGDAALAQFRAALQKVPFRTYTLYLSAANVYADRKDWNSYTELWRRALQTMPHNRDARDWLARGLAEQGQTQAALDALRVTLQNHVADQWEASHYREWASKLMSADFVRSTLEELRLRQPWNQALWSEAADQLKDAKDDNGVDALWLKALASNPAAPWVYEAAIDHLLKQRHWAAADALLYRLQGQQGLASLNMQYVIEHAYRIVEQADITHDVPRDQLVALNAELDKNRGLLSENNYWWLTWRTGIVSNDETQRYRGLTSYMACEPDSARVYSLFDLKPWGNIPSEISRIQIEIDRIKRHAVWRYMDRDPYNPDKLETFGERHSQWLGDNVGGLWAYKRMEQIDPNYVSNHPDTRSRISGIYDRLGDSARNVKDYLGRSSISESDRYLGWFASARARAESQLGRTHLEFDPKAVRATITNTDGDNVVIEADLRSGKATLLQRGFNWVRATYDDNGNLISATNNSGQHIELVYDDRNQIKVMKGLGEGDLHFTYNAHGKPTVMEIDGVGRIDVTYDDHDNIQKVESDGGRAIALELTDRFQRLLDLTGVFGHLGVDVRIPSLAPSDPEVDELRQKFEDASADQVVDAALAYAEKLVAKIVERREYAEEAERVLDELLDTVAQEHKGQSELDAGMRALALWRESFRQTGQTGLSTRQWTLWFTYRDLFARMAQKGQLSDRSRATFTALAQSPSKLLPSAQWLPKDKLSNPGLWRRVTQLDMSLGVPSGSTLSAVLVRANGDVVAAGSSGFYVHRFGYWQFYGFDAAASRFTTARGGKSESLSILSLTEDTVGAVWIGTKSRVIRLGGDYDGDTQRWAADTAKAFQAAYLVPFGRGVLAGGANGLKRFDDTGEKPLALDPREMSAPVKVLRALPGDDEHNSAALLGNAYGVFRVGEQVARLADVAVDDLLWSPSDQLVFELQGGEVWISHWRGEGAFDPAIRLGDIAVAGDVGIPSALTEVSGEEGESIPALLTDKGMALWGNYHFELLAPPSLAQDEKIVATAGTRERLWLVTGAAALLRFGSDAPIFSNTIGQVYDIIALPSQSAVAIARGENGLQLSRDGARPKDFSDIEATVLARDDAGRLIANNNFEIVRFSPDLSTSETLFSAGPSKVPKDETDPQFHKVSSLLVASDGAIWVTAGPSVFRWQNGKVQEFNMFLDPKTFPAKSDAISRVVETIDHRIWVVASNEGHRRIGSDYLYGGLFEYTPAGFRAVHVPQNEGWFITGYTKVDASTGIAGTSAGFYRHRSDQYVPILSLGDDGYNAIHKDHPALYLGGRGARLGNNTWLFGTADGVIALHDGKWFRPAQLNAVLPDFPALGFGGSTVHAVATDVSGRVYVGTDLGLLIYGSGGDWLDLEDHDGKTAAAMDETEDRRLAATVEVMPPPEDTVQSGKIADEVHASIALRQEAGLISAALEPGALEWAHPETTAENDDNAPAVRPGAAISSARIERLKEMLKDRNRLLDHTLAALKANAPEFYDEIKRPTASLDAVWKAAGPEIAMRAALIEYLLESHKLIIRLSTPTGSIIKTVAVNSEAVTNELKRALTALRRGGTSDEAALKKTLASFYGTMLRPIEPDLGDRDLLLVVPDPKLADLPMGALLSDPVTTDYAIRKFAFAYFPSLQSAATMLGLPSADCSAQVVSFDGKDVGASVSPQVGSAISAARPWANVMLAGTLDLAADRRLILTFGDPGTSPDLALLSSGRFCGVMFENLTLQDGVLDRDALALTLARGRTVDTMLPLWPVGERAESAVGKAFYDAMQSKRLGPADALAAAQRAILQASAADDRDPRAWASYIVIGRP
jgi:YD repeat-containing protein